MFTAILGDDPSTTALLIGGTVLAGIVTAIQIIRRKNESDADAKKNYPFAHSLITVILLLGMSVLAIMGLDQVDDLANLVIMLCGLAVVGLLAYATLRLFKGPGSIWFKLVMSIVIAIVIVMTLAAITLARAIFSTAGHFQDVSSTGKFYDTLIFMGDVLAWILTLGLGALLIFLAIRWLVRKIKAWRVRRAAPTSGSGGGHP